MQNAAQQSHMQRRISRFWSIVEDGIGLGITQIACRPFIHIIYLFTCLRHDNGRVAQCQNTSAGKFIFKSFAPQPNMRRLPQQVLPVAVASWRKNKVKEGARGTEISDICNIKTMILLSITSRLAEANGLESVISRINLLLLHQSFCSLFWGRFLYSLRGWCSSPPQWERQRLKINRP